MLQLRILPFCSIWLLCFLILWKCSESIWLNTSREDDKFVQSAKHQIMFLVDDDTTLANDFIRNVAANVPSLYSTLDNLTESNIPSQFGGNIRETTIFVVVFGNENLQYSRLSILIEMMRTISYSNPLPKLLIVHMENANYEEILKFFWKSVFLDVSILQLTPKSLSSKLQRMEKFPVLHQYNPYSNVYGIQKLGKIENENPEFDWFSDKGRNLYGKNVQYVWKLLYDGYFTVFEGLAKKMNFKLKPEKISLPESNGNFGCDEKIIYKDFRGLLGRRKQFIIGIYNYYHNFRCKRHALLRSHVLYLESMIAVVPVTSIEISTDPFDFSFVLPILMTLFIIALMRLILLELNFTNELWQTFNIFGIVIIGTGLRDDPRSFKERFVLVCLLLMSIVFSGFFHSLLVEMHLQIIPKREIHTLQDLVNSKLPVFMGPALTYQTSASSTEKMYYEKLQSQGIVYTINYQRYDCMNDLVKYKNVSCVMASVLFENWRKENINLLKKFDGRGVEEPMAYAGRVIWMQRSLPYADNVNRGLKGMIETGLMDKWGFYKSSKETIPPGASLNEDASFDLSQRVLTIAVIGYTMAFIVFIGEILINFINSQNSLVRKL